MVRLKRRPNGYGTVKTLSGRRSCPYLPCVSFNGEQKPLNAFSDPDDAFTALEIAKLRYDDKLSAKEAESHFPKSAFCFKTSSLEKSSNSCIGERIYYMVLRIIDTAIFINAVNASTTDCIIAFRN